MMDDRRDISGNMLEWERIWAQRAEEVARPEQEDTPGEQLTVVLIRLGREIFGLDVETVLEIRPKEAITYVPRVPAWVLGVTNVRGRVLSVVDLQAYLGLPSGPQAEHEAVSEEFLIAVQHQEMELLLWCHEVVGVETLPLHQAAFEALLHPLRREYVQAIVERKTGLAGQRQLIVINISALLSDPRLIVHEV